MKKMNFKGMLVAIAIVALGGLNTVEAQRIETLNVGVTARLANQLTVTKVSDVDFGGIFIPLTATANIRMNYQGNVAVQAGNTTLYSTELQQRGHFYVTADKDASFSVQYPIRVDLNHSETDAKLVYTPAIFDIDGNDVVSSSTTKYAVNQESYKVFYIGGDLAVANTNQSGLYHGTFDVSITWQ